MTDIYKQDPKESPVYKQAAAEAAHAGVRSHFWNGLSRVFALAGLAGAVVLFVVSAWPVAVAASAGAGLLGYAGSKYQSLKARKEADVIVNVAGGIAGEQYKQEYELKLQKQQEKELEKLRKKQEKAERKQADMARKYQGTGVITTEMFTAKDGQKVVDEETMSTAEITASQRGNPALGQQQQEYTYHPAQFGGNKAFIQSMQARAAAMEQEAQAVSAPERD